MSTDGLKIVVVPIERPAGERVRDVLDSEACERLGKLAEVAPPSSYPEGIDGYRELLSALPPAPPMPQEPIERILTLVADISREAAAFSRREAVRTRTRNDPDFDARVGEAVESLGRIRAILTSLQAPS